MSRALCHGFYARRGDFTSLEGATLIELPAIRYTCLMDAFTWFMDEARLELRNTTVDPASKTFQELRVTPKQLLLASRGARQSSFFESSGAIRRECAHLTCEKVVARPIADARIKPHEGLVSIGATP